MKKGTFALVVAPSLDPTLYSEDKDKCLDFYILSDNNIQAWHVDNLDPYWTVVVHEKELDQ